MATILTDYLSASTSHGGLVTLVESGWRLQIPAGPGGVYRLAQLDDYLGLPRDKFRHQPPCSISLECRTSAAEIPGTWGFGLWNDPFSLSLGLGGGTRRFPALPNTAWYFFASPPNYLSFRDDLPAHGSLAATFRAPPAHPLLLALAAPLAAGLVIPFLGRIGRRLLRRRIQQDTLALVINPVVWHDFQIAWNRETVSFSIDGIKTLETRISPIGPLGFVVWIDNQYVALPPNGQLAYGTLPNLTTSWIEVRNLTITQGKTA
jgi:hypothetical protein